MSLRRHGHVDILVDVLSLRKLDMLGHLVDNGPFVFSLRDALPGDLRHIVVLTTVLDLRHWHIDDLRELRDALLGGGGGVRRALLRSAVHCHIDGLLHDALGNALDGPVGARQCPHARRRNLASKTQPLSLVTWLQGEIGSMR